MGNFFNEFSISFLCLSLLTFEGLAQLQLQPLSSSTIAINNGDAVTLDCEASNANGDEDVEWYHDTNVISFGTVLLRDRDTYSLEVTSNTADSPTTSHWIIRIGNVNVLRDRGSWSCRFNGQRVETELLQIGPPSIDSVTPNLNNPQLNSDVRLECLASGNPTPSVTWSRTYPVPYILMNGARKGFIRKTENNTISLNPLAMEHRGEYRCSVTNGHGDTLTRTTYVRLPYVPEVTASIRNIRVTAESQAVLACISQAYPPTSSELDVQWTLNGTEVNTIQLGASVDVDRHPDDFYDERYYSRLTIRSVNENHIGSYECMFSNEQGQASATVSLGLEPTIDHDFGRKIEL